jgi:glucose-6-phosphate isomerase
MVTFEALYKSLKTRYNEEEIRERIIVTTDKENGHLLEMAKRIGCKRFVFPSNVGGRFSTLTTVGLFPICVAGIDIRSILDGARSAKQNRRDYYKYLAVRQHMYSKGKYVEVFNVYEPKLESFTEWIQQIFAETQGKFKKGIFPISMVNTGKLHSLGQYLQEGTPISFETSIDVERNSDFYVEKYNRYMDTMNSIALKSVAMAHHAAGRYTGIITIDEINPYNMGYLYAFFSIVSTLGAYMDGNNYANQPGVNQYKEIMNAQLNI